MPELSEYLSLTKLFKKDIKAVYTNIEDEINNDIELSELDNVSKNSTEGQMIYLPAYISWFMENYVFKVFQKMIQAIIDANTSQTDAWWSTEMKKFQDGDTLLWNATTKKYYYATIDPVKQIIKYCSVTSSGGICTVKLSKEDREPLTNDELNRAIAYGDRVQPAGANIEYISIASDLLKAPYTLYYDPLKNLDDIKPLVEAAIEAYLLVLNDKGEFNINSYEDAIQTVSTIKRIKRGTIEAKEVGGVYAEVTDIVYLTRSGFIKIDPDFSLEDVITYLPA